MSLKGEEALILSESYTDEALEGAGALKGEDGKSAYQIWLDLGNTGTEQDFIDSLKGDGVDGFSPVITENSNNTDEDYRLDIETKESKFTTPNLKADISKNIAEHNTSPDSHNDIRIFLNELNNRLNALANSDDETLDEMKEVVAYIKDNRSLIESITTTKVNVADIIDNLTTNVSNKPLSASQGVVIKNLIDTLQSELTAHVNNADIHVTANDKTNWNNATDKINDLKIADVNGLQTIADTTEELNNTTQRLYQQTIDLTDASYDQNTWYPCTGTAMERFGKTFYKINVAVHLNSYAPYPYWATHVEGFSCDMLILAKPRAWGVTNGATICLEYFYNFVSDDRNPCGYSQMGNSSVPVLHLRGGGMYHVYTDYECEWEPRTYEFTHGQETVVPLSENPGIVILTKSTIHANLEGIASQAISLVDSMSLKTIDVPTNYIYDVIGDKEGNIHYGEGVGVVNLRVDFFTTYEIEASKILAIYVEADKKLKGFVWDPLIESQVISGNTLYSFEIKDINSNSGSATITSCKLLYMV